MRTAVICVSGRIQEVGYRTRVMGLAHVLGVTGYVRNLPDTRVEIIAQASEEVLEEFIEKIGIQDEMVHVDAVKVDYSEQFKGFRDFHKIVGPNETDSRLDKAVIALNDLVAEMKEFRKESREDNKELLTTIQEGNQELKQVIQEGNQELKQVIQEGNQELKGEIQGLRDEVHAGNHEFREFRKEFHEFKEDNKSNVLEEIREVKNLIKVHLKIP